MDVVKIIERSVAAINLSVFDNSSFSFILLDLVSANISKDFWISDGVKDF